MRTDRDVARASLGVVLIAVGVAFLAGQALGIDVGRYGWPIVIVGVGALMLLMGLAGVDPSRGLVYPGTIVTTVGLILLYQNTTRHWESWAYVWALIPASVGLARALQAALAGRARGVRGGLSTAAFFVLLFAVGFAFFEGALRISGRDFGAIGQYGFPLLLIAAGLWMLLSRTLLVDLER